MMKLTNYIIKINDKKIIFQGHKQWIKLKLLK